MMIKKLSHFDRNLVIFKIGLMQNLVYRFNMIIGLIGSLLGIFILRFLWISLYQNDINSISVSLEQTLTYVIISVIIKRIYPDQLVRVVEERIKTGNIIFDITRPMNLMNLLFSETLGQMLAFFLTTSIPLIIISYLCFSLVLPSSILVWIGFLVSFLFGIIIIFLIDFMFSMTGFWTTGMTGIFFAKKSLISILSGAMIPLWIYPDIITKILEFSPFPAITYIPISIFIGHIPKIDIPTYLLTQFVWIIVLFALSVLLFNKAIKKLTVLGG